MSVEEKGGHYSAVGIVPGIVLILPIVEKVHTVSSRIYAQSLSSQIKMKVGGGRYCDQCFALSEYKFENDILSKRGCALSRTERIGARIMYTVGHSDGLVQQVVVLMLNGKKFGGAY